MPKPLDQFPLIRTRDAEEMRALLKNLLGIQNVVYPEGVRGLHGYANRVQLRHINLSFWSHGAPVRFQLPEADSFRQQFCIRGRGTTGTERCTIEINRQRSCVTNAGIPTRHNLGASLEQLVLGIPKGLFEDKLVSLLGSHSFPPLRFKSAVGVDEPTGRHVRNLVWFLAQTLDENSAGIPQAAIDELEQTIAITFLHCVRSSVSELLERKPPTLAPWQVRRAEEYIEAHWSEPLRTEVLANAVNTSVRSLFKTFAEFRGYTPMEFLRDVRLRHAREMLMQPDEATTVTAAGLACGFLNLGHFAKHYQTMFGELPSDTLARTRGDLIRGNVVVRGSVVKPVRG
jgi:AraC-like DNA-binding protein